MAIYARMVTCTGFTSPVQVKDTGNSTGSIGLLAPSTNEETVYIGSKKDIEAAEKGTFPLAKSSFISLGIKDASLLYVAGKAGDKLAYIVEGV